MLPDIVSKMLGNLFSSFGKSASSSSDKKKKGLKDLSVGDYISLRFKDPRKLGLIDPSNSLTKRYDPEDLETRLLIGVISRIFQSSGLTFFELGVIKMVNGQRKERIYTLMEDDIEEIKVLQAHDDSNNKKNSQQRQ